MQQKFLRTRSPVKTLSNLRLDWLERDQSRSVTKLKAIFFKGLCRKANNPRNARSLLEKLHWLPLGKLVNVSPGQTQAGFLRFSFPSLVESA